MEAASITQECNHGCPACCAFSPAQIEAESDREARNRALTFSGIVTVLLLSAHVYTFLTKGVALPIPDILWGVVLGPWLGHGASKLLELSTKGQKR